MGKKYSKAIDAIEEHTVHAMVGVGFIPTPSGDTISAVSIQSLMLNIINSIYKIKISNDLILKITGLSASALGTFEVSKYATGGLSIPLQVASTATLTYAMGRAYLKIVDAGESISVSRISKNMPSFATEGAKFVFSEGGKRAVRKFGKKFWNLTENTAEVLTDIFKEAGKVAYDAGRTAGKVASVAANVAGNVAYETAKATGKVASGAANVAGDVAYETAKVAGKAAKGAKKIIKKLNPFW